MQDTCQSETNHFNYSHTPSRRRPQCDYEIHSLEDIEASRASANEVQATPNPYGRYAAGRPHSSMAHIIHNSPMVDESPERINRRRPSTDNRMDHSRELIKQDDEQPRYGELNYINNAENYAPSEPANDVPDTVTEVDSTEDNSKDVKGSPTGSQDGEDPVDEPAVHQNLSNYHTPLW